MKEKVAILVLLICAVKVFSQELKTDTFRLFYLGGQSNMDGYGYNSKLPDSLNTIFEDVYIFHGNPVGDNEKNGGLGNWTQLRPGHGVGFKSDSLGNNYSNRFGVELSFASKLKQLYPNNQIAIIKYSRGGTSIDSLAGAYAGSWDPDFSGVNQYDYFLKTVKNALKIKDINQDGKEDVLIPKGIIWMQGESDAAYTEAVAEEYYSNLKRLMTLQRAALHNNKLPIVIGKISDSRSGENGKTWHFLELVQYAQEKFAQNDNKASVVRTTKNYEYSDPWHYDSKGFIDLGEQFAKAIKKLNDKK